MRGGHNRKPTQLKVVRGTARKGRLKREPKPKPTAPTCPNWLPKEAKTEWRRLVAELNELRLLGRIDRDGLADLCLCIVRLRQAEKEITEKGLMVETAEGDLKRNPNLITCKEYRGALRMWAERYGLTPADRGRLDVPPAPVETLRERLRRRREEPKELKK